MKKGEYEGTGEKLVRFRIFCYNAIYLMTLQRSYKRKGGRE